MTKPPTPDEEPGFDQVLTNLRGVVERLESGKLTLEESLATFEQGVQLARQGNQILDAAEQRVDVLLRDPAGEKDRIEPFSDPK